MSSKKVSVTLTYTSSGAQPPIFLAGSFSEPAWHPQEMDFTTDENGEHNFHKEVEVDEGGQFQYKFRIGLGDWWTLNEQAPTVTDELGNKNNLLSVPTSEEIAEKPKPSEPATAPPVSDMPVPEVVVEKVDEEPRLGDDFGPDATTGQKDAHEMRAQDAEPDHVVIRSQTNTPVYAKTAAEVADSAAMLDREPSPAPVSDEEAGRTGERRMSSTPIPQVALTAAEVADVAAILDQDDEDDEDHMGMNHLQLHYPYDTPSGATTPWHERAPLFAHECLGLNEGGEEEESPITSESVESPTKPEPEEEVIDPNDPLLEPFPEDCMSILTHIRSCESRMSEDETNVHGVPPSPITKPKSRSSSIETPGSARLDAQPSPALDVIAEEHHEEDSYFGGLPGPSQKVQGAEEVRVPEELNVIHEVEEPAEDPKTVLDNLQKIEEATGDSNKIAVKDESAETTEVEERMPVEDSGMAEERNMTDATSEQMKEPTEAKESLKLETMDSADDSQTGLTAIEVQTDPEDYVVREDHHADLEELSAPEQTSDMAEHVQDPPEQVHDDLVNFVGKDHLEHAHDNLVNLVGQHQPEDGPVPEIPVEPKSDFTEQENANAGSSDVERKEDFQQNSKLLHAEDDEEPQNVAVDKQSILVQPSEPGPIADPQLAEPKGEAPEDEKPNDDLKEIMQPQWNNELQQHDGHLQSVEEEPRHVDESRKMAEPTQLSEPKQAEESQLDSINGISMGGAIMKDLPAESTAEVRDVEQAASWQGLTQERDVLGSDAHQSAIALENPHPEAERSVEADLPISQTNADEELPPAPEHDVLGSKSRIENASEVETSHEANLPISQIKADDEIAPIHVEAVTSGANDVDEVEETLPNGVDTAKSTSVDAPSPNGHDNDTKLTPRKTATPNIERPLTPSIRSPMKVPESENFLKAIWRTVFVEWLGGIIAHLCGGERGP